MYILKMWPHNLNEHMSKIWVNNKISFRSYCHIIWQGKQTNYIIIIIDKQLKTIIEDISGN